jgi:hypothetical protein
MPSTLHDAIHAACEKLFKDRDGIPTLQIRSGPYLETLAMTPNGTTLGVQKINQVQGTKQHAFVEKPRSDTLTWYAVHIMPPTSNYFPKERVISNGGIGAVHVMSPTQQVVTMLQQAVPFPEDYFFGRHQDGELVESIAAPMARHSRLRKINCRASTTW